MSKQGIKISLGSKKADTKVGTAAAKPTKPLNNKPEKRVKKATFSFGSDDEGDDENEGKVVAVTHFDADKGGAHHESDKPVVKRERVIDCVPNRDWRAEANRKRQKSTLPGQPNTDDDEYVMVQGPMKYGLNVKANSKSQHKYTLSNDSEYSIIEIDDDASIVDAIDDDEMRRTPTMANLESLAVPDAPTLDEYAAMPVEEFGAAMLRGMGWKGEDKSSEKKSEKKKANGGSVQPRRRPALLGIGAKPMEEEQAKKD